MNKLENNSRYEGSLQKALDHMKLIGIELIDSKDIKED